MSTVIPHPLVVQKRGSFIFFFFLVCVCVWGGGGGGGGVLCKSPNLPGESGSRHGFNRRNRLLEWIKVGFVEMKGDSPFFTIPIGLAVSCLPPRG